MPEKRIMPLPPPGWESWEELMHLALEQAKKAKKLEEIPVGAIVVDHNGKIIGSGYNTPLNNHDPTAHAEILAIRQAAASSGNYRLNEALLIVTLEPCLMCATAAVHARLAGVIYGARDDKTGAVESCITGLELSFNNHTPWHCGGILENECAELLKSFFSKRR